MDIKKTKIVVTVLSVSIISLFSGCSSQEAVKSNQVKNVTKETSGSNELSDMLRFVKFNNAIYWETDIFIPVTEIKDTIGDYLGETSYIDIQDINLLSDSYTELLNNLSNTQSNIQGGKKIYSPQNNNDNNQIILELNEKSFLVFEKE